MWGTLLGDICLLSHIHIRVLGEGSARSYTSVLGVSLHFPCSEKCEKLLFLADLVGWGMGGSPAAPGSCASGDGLPSICHVSGATRGS